MERAVACREERAEVERGVMESVLVEVEGERIVKLLTLLMGRIL